MDNRRPDKVKFVNVLKRDLARRDFSINAMAYNPTTGLIDYYGGQQDLADKLIKCVGNPNKRFQEDALRIMRALRFAAALGFEIEKTTAQAMHDNRKLLNNIAVERIAIELNKLLLGNNVRELLLAHFDILTTIIPELSAARGFKQNNPYHCYDVLEHILYSVENAPKDIIIRLIMLFHDIGKPNCYSEADGIGHFYGHPQASTDMTKDILTRLKYDNDTIKAVTELVLYHDSEINRKQHIKRWLNKIGEERFRQLIKVKKADALAQAEHVRQDRIAELNGLLIKLDEILAEQQCFSLKDLEVNGRDLLEAGVPQGTQIGVILNRLMDMVIDDEAANDREVLLEIARGRI
jgi:tRNA nucleotidyltransferase (CCA-adding enzyme)